MTDAQQQHFPTPGNLGPQINGYKLLEPYCINLNDDYDEDSMLTCSISSIYGIL